MYEYTDRNLEELKRKVKAYFQNSRLGLMKYDEINKADIDKEVDNLYDNVQKLADDLIEGLVNELATIYPIDKKKYPKERLFDAYIPVLMYVYANEVERKRERYKEAIVSSVIDKALQRDNLSNNTVLATNRINSYKGTPIKTGKRKDFDNKTIIGALSSISFLQNMNANANNMNRQIEETAIDSERGIILDFGKDSGEEYVRWVTAEDERVCLECGELHGQIFLLDEIPERCHCGCRCTFEFVSEEEYKDFIGDEQNDA